MRERSLIVTCMLTTAIIGSVTFTFTSAQVGVVGKSIAITGVTIIDVLDGGLLRDQTVVVTGNRISQVALRAESKMSAGAQVVDGNGRYLIPSVNIGCPIRAATVKMTSRNAAGSRLPGAVWPVSCRWATWIAQVRL